MRAVDKLLQALPADGSCLGIGKLAKATGLKRTYITERMPVLIDLGLVGRMFEGCFALTEAGIERRNAGQQLDLRKGRNGSADKLRDRLWAAMRAARKFDLWDLLAAAVRIEDKAPKPYARRYVARLVAAGVLTPLKRQKGSTQRWLLTHDLGPEAPTWRPSKGGLWDWNSGHSVIDAVRAAQEALQ